MPSLPSRVSEAAAAVALPRVCLIIVFRVSGVAIAVARLVPAQGGILMNSRLPHETLKPDLEASRQCQRFQELPLEVHICISFAADQVFH